ncbi:hypothetical protein DPMN_050606 [Dreissena polymorpha]|uniref:Uncharacterized protein n=1 Tax=Dreissena polymorpha TaxID=45954 RepID=A0A9D4HN59_DREPO|nr:hypothetical protein DPMN_050606 [Dreissena polymorpha]
MIQVLSTLKVGALVRMSWTRCVGSMAKPMGTHVFSNATVFVFIIEVNARQGKSVTAMKYMPLYAVRTDKLTKTNVC